MCRKLQVEEATIQIFSIKSNKELLALYIKSGALHLIVLLLGKI
jgi:hypothetical protein